MGLNSMAQRSVTIGEYSISFESYKGELVGFSVYKNGTPCDDDDVPEPMQARLIAAAAVREVE